MLPLIGVQIIGANYFQAVGKAYYAVVFSLLRQIIVLIPAAYLLSRLWGLTGVWIAGPTADLASVLDHGAVRVLRSAPVSQALVPPRAVARPARPEVLDWVDVKADAPATPTVLPQREKRRSQSAVAGLAGVALACGAALPSQPPAGAGASLAAGAGVATLNAASACAAASTAAVSILAATSSRLWPASASPCCAASENHSHDWPRSCGTPSPRA